MDTQPPLLDYRSPYSAPPSEPPFSLAACIAGCVVAAVLAIDLLIITPRFEQIFKDFGTKLPAITGWLLTASRFTQRGGWVILPLLPIAAGFLAALARSTSPPASETEGSLRRVRRRSRIATLTILAIGLVAIVTLIALFAPMLSLLEAVSGKK